MHLVTEGRRICRCRALAHNRATMPDTAAYYTNTIMWLRDTHPRYVTGVREYLVPSTAGAP